MKYRWLRLALVPLALLVVAFVRTVRPWVLIRFGEICSFRVGHLAGNTECFLCQRDASGIRSIDVFAHTGRIANAQLAKMFNRVMLVDPTRFVSMVMTVDRRFRGWEKHVAEPLQFDRDVTNQFEAQPPHLKFTPAELRRGERERRAMGIPDGAKWVCLIVRDAAYLTALAGVGAAYHDYRDSDISDYKQAALMLAERGYYVLRMGAMVKEEFRCGHSRVIDYATNGARSDFMDVYLGAHCYFCVSTGVGFDSIPGIFRKPICYVNYAPLEYFQTWIHGIAIWRHHIKDGRRMTPAEIFDGGVGQALASGDFERNGITFEPNSPQEIVDAVDEMEALVAMGEPTRQDDSMQQRFWRGFPLSMSPYNARRLHGKIRLRIGTKFLRQYEKRLAVAA